MSGSKHIHTARVAALLILILPFCCASILPPHSVLFEQITGGGSRDGTPITNDAPVSPKGQVKLLECNCTTPDGLNYCATYLTSTEILGYAASFIPGYYYTTDNNHPLMGGSTEWYTPPSLPGGYSCTTTQDFLDGYYLSSAYTATNVCGDFCYIKIEVGMFNRAYDQKTTYPAEPLEILSPDQRDVQCPFTFWPDDGRCGSIGDGANGNTTFRNHKYCCGRLEGAVPTANAFGYPCGCAEGVPCHDCGAYPTVPWNDVLFEHQQFTGWGYAEHPVTEPSRFNPRVCGYQPYIATAEGHAATYDNCALDDEGARWCCYIDGRAPVFDPFVPRSFGHEPPYCTCTHTPLNVTADPDRYQCKYCASPLGGTYPDAWYEAYPKVPRSIAPIPPNPLRAEDLGSTPSPTATTTASTAGRLVPLSLATMWWVAVGWGL